MTVKETAAIIGRGEGVITRGQAGEIAFKIRAADSGEAYSRWEYLVRLGGVSSPHYHLKIYESRAFAYLAHRIRQLIEVVNAQLQGQFAIKRTLARALWGLVTRVQAKLTAHAFGVYLNLLFGRPPRALKTLLV